MGEEGGKRERGVGGKRERGGEEREGRGRGREKGGERERREMKIEQVPINP